MFNWGWDNLKYNKRPEVNSIPTPSVNPPKPEKNSDGGYTIGVNTDGQTVLKLTCDYQTVTITMTTVGTRQMIKLLEATLINEEEDNA